MTLAQRTGETVRRLASRRKSLQEGISAGEQLVRRTDESAPVAAGPVADQVSVASVASIGSRSFIPFAQVDLRTSIRPTVAEVDLYAIRRNFDRMTELVFPAAVWAVIKADAYGHGAVAVARTLADRSSALAVSLVEEGLELRAAGITVPIVVLGAFYDRCHAQVVDEGLTPVIYDAADLDFFAAAAARRATRIDVHIKIDTGMSRLGVAPLALADVLDSAARLSGVRVAGRPDRRSNGPHRSGRCT